jgi:hypothetical protein
MPEKKKIKTVKLAARKTPIKKAATKRAAKKTVRIKPDKPKKIATKQSPAKKLVKKTTAGTNKKRIKSSADTTKETVRKPRSETKEVTVDIVDLPNNASLRSVAKAKAISENLDEYIAHCVYRIAVTSAACFLLVGSTLAVSGLYGDTSDLMISRVPTTVNSAQLIHSLSEQEGDYKNTQNALSIDSFELLTEIPEQIYEDFRLTFVSDADTQVRAVLLNSDNKEKTDLAIESVLDGRHRAEIKVRDHESGYYRIEFEITTNSQTLTTKYSREFIIRSDAETGSVEDSEFLLDVATSTDLDSNPDSATNSSVSENDELESFRLTVETLEADLLSLKIVSPDNHTHLEVFARPLNSLREQFLGLPTKRDDEWFAVINTSHLPNGSYEIFAKGLHGEFDVLSESAVLSISRQRESTAETNEVTASNSAIIADDAEDLDVRVAVDANIDEPTREFAPTSLADIVWTGAQYQTQMITILADYQTELDSLLRAYAVSYQSGNTILNRETELNFNKFTEVVLKNLARDDEFLLILDNLEALLTSNLETLKTRTRTFEDLRNESSRGKAAVDTDLDGLSDFDEAHFYGTDHELFDTDGDGISDGLEIISGFNPLNDSSESLITLVSPQGEPGLVVDGDVVINSIKAVAPASTYPSESSVKAELKGRSFPNSFVTIFIVSEPVIFSVKTDDEGEFTYLLEKELRDGQHEAFATIVNNDGSIAAQSQPFVFTKKAKTFNRIDERIKTVPLAAAVVEADNSNFDIVVGVSVIAFGLILLMLGVSLRGKRDAMAQEENAKLTT